MSKLNKTSLEYPQIDAAFKYIYDNPDKYHYRQRDVAPLTDIYEFGVFNGKSLLKICEYVRDNPSLIGMPIDVKGFDSFEGLPEEQDKVPVFDKFKEANYKAEKTPEQIENIIKYITQEDVTIYKTWFDKINVTYPLAYIDYKPALLIHIDCDLYISTLQALRYMMNNGLIHDNTLIAYDEFESTSKSGGERRAHKEIFKNIKTDEVWHNIYYDKDNNQRIRQSVFEIIL